MKFSAERKWISLAFIAALLPISLLVTFRLTGMLPEPQTPETITVEAVSWNMSRPSTTMSFLGMRVKNLFSDYMTSVESSVHITSYKENSELFGDCIWFSVNATAQLQKGFIHSMFIRLSGMDPDAVLYIHLLGPWPKMHNLKTESIVTGGTENREAYIRATRLDRSANCSLEIVISWHFLDIKENNISHWTTVTLEATYFNGTVYRKVIIPIRIGVLV